MLSKDVTTVRVSNLHHDVSIADLYTFFHGYDLEPISPSSLCPCSTSNDATQVATVTFKSASEAKKALVLRGKAVRGSSIEIERDFMGLTILAEPKQPTVDIIAVHGLNGHAFGTWCSRETGSSNGGAMWLRDFLPEKVNGARVMIYGYNSILLGPNTSVSVVSDFASDLLQRVMDDRAYGQVIDLIHEFGNQ
ncbi:hypothetical protein MMC15_003304 [Xylographa vitiligo]|nr:hypothetical protein [Xylographa vitiligo]